MSSISGLNNSTSAASYAAQLAQKSQLNNSLDDLDKSIQSGNLTGAANILSTLIKNNPQYATSTDSSKSSDPINKGFTTLTTALSNNDAEAARSAWSQLKSDMSDAGVTIKDSTANTRELVTGAKQAVNESILSSIGIASPENSSLLTSLLSTSSNTSNDSMDSLVSNWVTYKATGGNPATVSLSTTTTTQTSTSTPTTETTLNVTA